MEKILNKCCSEYRKIHLRVKKGETFLLMPPRQNYPPSSYRHRSGRDKLFIPPGSIFFLCIPPADWLKHCEK